MRNKAIELRRQGFSIEEISKKLNRAKSTISKYVVGVNKPNNEKLYKGEIKLRKGTKVFETIPDSDKDLVPVSVGDPKNTIIYMRRGDCANRVIKKYMNR